MRINCFQIQCFLALRTYSTNKYDKTLFGAYERILSARVQTAVCQPLEVSKCLAAVAAGLAPTVEDILAAEAAGRQVAELWLGRHPAAQFSTVQCWRSATPT